MDKLKLTGWNLCWVFNSRLGSACIGHAIAHITKQPNLKLKTRSPQSVTLSYSFQPHLIFLIEVWGLYYETLRICRSWRYDKCCSKLATSWFGHAHQLGQTNTLAYYRLHSLRIRIVFMIQAKGAYPQSGTPQGTPSCQSYKTFYGRNLLFFVISWSVCPWQAFPA